jgi:hypothetical protein
MVDFDPSISAVELKITVRAEEENLVRAALDRADVEPEHRQVFFFDTGELDLFEAGVVLRARLVRDGADDSTVKLRPVVPTEIAESWKELDGFEVEVDAVGEQAVCSAKLSADQHRHEIEEVAEGDQAIRKLFSDEQERLLEEHAPAEVGWDRLSVLGPIEVRKWETTPKDFAREITVEEWVLPDGSDLVEISVKVEPAETAGAKVEFDDYLRSRGVDTRGDQQTKTRTALTYFTR